MSFEPNDLPDEPNTPDGVARKGAALGATLAEIAEATTLAFSRKTAQQGVEVPDDTSWLAFVETAFLYVHFAERVALELLGHSLGDPFVDSLRASAMEALSRSHGDARKTAVFRDAFATELGARAREYAPHGLDFGLGVGMPGTLRWEFAKKLARLVDPEERTPEVLFTAFSCVAAGLDAAEIPRVLGSR